MKVAVGRAQIETVTTDHQEGVWVGTGPRVFHVSPTGAVSRLPLSSVRPGNYASVTSMAVDHQGNLWLAVARGYEQLTREVIEYSPNGQVRTFKVGRRFFPTERIGVSGGQPVIRSGHKFLRLDRAGVLSRRVSVPDRPCTLTETAEIWCKTWASNSIYRALPKGDPSRRHYRNPGSGFTTWSRSATATSGTQPKTETRATRGRAPASSTRPRRSSSVRSPALKLLLEARAA